MNCMSGFIIPISLTHNQQFLHMVCLIEKKKLLKLTGSCLYLCTFSQILPER